MTLQKKEKSFVLGHKRYSTVQDTFDTMAGVKL